MRVPVSAEHPMRDRIVNWFTWAVLCTGLAACVLHGEGDRQPTLLAADDVRPIQTFFIGGKVEGATGVLTLQNSNGRTLTLRGNGSFVFETQMVSKALYNVTVPVHPDAQICLVTHGSGTVNSADIRDVTVTCTPSAYLTAKR
jgi:hypothetical protein